MFKRLVRFYHHLPARTCGASQPLRSHVTLGRDVRGSGLHVDHPAVAIVRQDMMQVVGQRRRSIALAVLP